MKTEAHIDLALDAEGRCYTTHCFTRNDDPWYGATILTPVTVRDLRTLGLLPLREVQR